VCCGNGSQPFEVMGRQVEQNLVLASCGGGTDIYASSTIHVSKI
jgi:hypothetical protein